MKRWVRVTAFAAAAIWLVGCATPNLNPAQERAYAAFKDCQTLSPTAQLGEITEAGGLAFTARPGDYQRMTRCLEEKHGYKSQ